MITSLILPITTLPKNLPLDGAIAMLLIVLLLIIIIGISIYWSYIAPKLGLFEDGRRAKNFRSMQKIFPAKVIHRSDNPYTLNLVVQKSLERVDRHRISK
jgi:hypothetical protein